MIIQARFRPEIFLRPFNGIFQGLVVQGDLIEVQLFMDQLLPGKFTPLFPVTVEFQLLLLEGQGGGAVFLSLPEDQVIDELTDQALVEPEKGHLAVTMGSLHLEYAKLVIGLQGSPMVERFADQEIVTVFQPIGLVQPTRLIIHPKTRIEPYLGRFSRTHLGGMGFSLGHENVL